MSIDDKARAAAAPNAAVLQGLQEASRVMAWDGDALAVTDPSSEVMRKLSKKKLSPSTANAMGSCLSRWAVEQVMRNLSSGDPFGPAESGTVAHAVLEDLFALPVAQRTRDAAEQLIQTVHKNHEGLVVPADPLTMAKWRDRIRILIGGLWDIADPSQVRVMGREVQLDTTSIEGVPFNGFIDRLDLVDAGLKIVDYKGLALDTVLPTPTGWTTMADVEVGDLVLGTAGPVTVTVKSSVHHDRPCYRLTFSDGSSVVADNVHLWTVRDLFDDTLHEAISTDGLAALVESSVAAGRPLSIVVDNPDHLDDLMVREGLEPADPDAPSYRVVVSVVPVESVPTQCIQVDAPDSLYLCGPGMVPTHNTGKMSTEVARRRFGDDHGEQQRMYALALLTRDGVLPAAAELQYTQHGKARDISLKPVALDKTRRTFVKAWDTLTTAAETQRYSTLPSGLCAYCPMATVCPTANRDKKVEPKNDNYLIGELLGLPLLEASPSTVKRPAPLSGSAAAADFAADMDSLYGSDEHHPVPDSVLDGAPVPDCDIPWSEPVDPDSHDSHDKDASEASGGPVTDTGQRHTSTEDIEAPASDRERKEDTVTLLKEDKPYVETTGSGLNPNSYAATGAFGIVSLAVETLHGAGKQMTGTAVTALANTLMALVYAEQEAVTSSLSMQDGLNTRLRGALRTVIETLPVPFDGDRQAWDDWYRKAGLRLHAITKAAIALWETGPVADPYGPLVVSSSDES